MRLNDVLRNEMMVADIFSDENMSKHWENDDESSMLK